jgi:hypothetical protein
MEPIGCPETSATSYQSTLRNIQNKSEYFIYEQAESWNHAFPMNVYSQDNFFKMQRSEVVTAHW